jgi:NAD(P)-dependent dehydrogenase (short-subunit alcohol dehydrogenase family)
VTPLFDGELALVTGAGRGIGRAIALELAAAGARVAVLARSADELDEVAGTVRDRGGMAGVFPADAADAAQVAGAMTRITAELGRVGILISNAAVVWPLGPIVTVTLAEWSAAFAVNVGAVCQLSAAVLPSMLEQGWGRIVNVSSGIAADPAAMIGGNAYATTKAVLEAHTINLAAELAGSGVTANVYRPGSVDTAMQAWIRGQSPERIGTALHEVSPGATKKAR